jgi:single-strand DNA-binding protein
MAGETQLTIVGNLTDDPALTFTQSGSAVANFTVASTPRTFDKTSNAWKDGEALFLRCSVWRDVAEHVAESLTRGARVLVTGRLVQRSFETKDGEKRTVIELQVDEIGPSLRYATATVKKADRSGTDSRPAPAEDPWGSAPQAPARQGAGGFADQPPF